MAGIANLNILPVIIDGPGEYTRDGGKVTIKKMNQTLINKKNKDETITIFPASGFVWEVFRGKYRPKGLAIYHLSGRLSFFGEKQKDIIAKI